jgi:hypothetical protein
MSEGEGREMPRLASHQLSEFYALYRDTEVTFNSQVIIESGLLTSDVHLTIGSARVACVLYACSMKGARVIAEVGADLRNDLTRANGMTALHMGFHQAQDPRPTTFFVPSHVESLSEYHPQKPQMQFITLEFMQKPTDVLIGTLGAMLEINSNALRRKDERIVLTPDVMKRIGLPSKESCIAIGGASRRCIVRDLSFGGAKILMSALATPQGEEKVLLKLARCELKDDTVLNGNVVRVEDIEGRNDLVALSIQFSTDPPISYKQKINSAFSGPMG